MKSLLIGAGNSTEKRITTFGLDHFEELTTLDLEGADINHDLEELPYPIVERFDEIHAYEVLEHTGSQGDFQFFFAQFNEFHRILKEGGLFCGSVPLPSSVWAWADPGHKRLLCKETFAFLTEEHYEQLGKTTCADYRPWIKGYWKILGVQEQSECLYFVLEKV